MFIEDNKEQLLRRVEETTQYATRVHRISVDLGKMLRTEADLARSMADGLNREGLITMNGLLHGLCYAAAVLCDGPHSHTVPMTGEHHE